MEADWFRFVKQDINWQSKKEMNCWQPLLISLCREHWKPKHLKIKASEWKCKIWEETYVQGSAQRLLKFHTFCCLWNCSHCLSCLFENEIKIHLPGWKIPLEMSTQHKKCSVSLYCFLLDVICRLNAVSAKQDTWDLVISLKKEDFPVNVKSCPDGRFEVNIIIDLWSWNIYISIHGNFFIRKLMSWLLWSCITCAINCKQFNLTPHS